MDDFFPFIHKIKKKKKELEPLPLYIELPQLPIPQSEPVEEDQYIIIIDL